MWFSRIQQSAWAWFAIAGSGALVGQVTTRSDSVGKLLNEWHTAGTAAGLTAITYENRDGGHSRLDASQWPQLRVRDVGGGDKGPANTVRPMPVIGNCSMASAATSIGSLPRLYMLQQQGFDFLAAQYADNNHFVYPEHQDYDPGWSGRGGWGDLYPVNTSCLTVCQGSSFKDMIFVRAFLAATAALPPETQKLILRKGWLAPTLQMLLRRGYKAGKTDDDYFTGKVHPPVFDGDLVDEDKMVSLAHAMTLDLIPPVVRLEVTGESKAESGRQFFEQDSIGSEVLGTSPFAIGRVFRSSEFVHEMLLTARNSKDAQDRPLTFKWVLLQGDLTRVRIEFTADGAEAKVAVAWHPEMRAADGIQTHRVDIGVFATNGAAWSAPAILSFYMLPNEQRFYDDQGRIEEICYDASNPDPGLPATDDLRWLALGSRLEQNDPGIAQLARALPEAAIVRLKALVKALSQDEAAWRKLSTEGSKKEEADRLRAALEKRLREGLSESFDNTGKSLAQSFTEGVGKVSAISDLYLARQDEIAALLKKSGKPDGMKQFVAARQRLLDLGILTQDTPDHFAPRVDLRALTTGEKYYLTQFHLTVLHLALLPDFIDRVEGPVYVDPHLTTPKAWRDVYRYNDDGQVAGWTRFMDGCRHEFDAQGRLLSAGAGGPAVPVKYVRDEKSGRLVFQTR